MKGIHFWLQIKKDELSIWKSHFCLQRICKNKLVTIHASVLCTSDTDRFVTPVPKRMLLSHTMCFRFAREFSSILLPTRIPTCLSRKPFLTPPSSHHSLRYACLCSHAMLFMFLTERFHKCIDLPVCLMASEHSGFFLVFFFA